MMKKLMISALLALLPFQAFAEAPEPVREVSGLQWLQLSVGKRFEQVLISMRLIANSGVSLDEAPSTYYDAIYETVKRDPTLYESPVTQILARYLYENRPELRPALDKLRAPSAAKTTPLGSTP